jgi:hypothetical protein
MKLLLSPQFHKPSTRGLPRNVKSVARVVAALPLSCQLGHESVIQLSPEHAGLIFRLAYVLHGCELDKGAPGGEIFEIRPRTRRTQPEARVKCSLYHFCLLPPTHRAHPLLAGGVREFCPALGCKGPSSARL